MINPRRRRALLFRVVAPAVVVFLLVLTYQYRTHWTPLQRFYFGRYVRAALKARIVFGAREADFRLVEAVAKGGHSRLATDDMLELRDNTTATGLAPLGLTAAARRAGWVGLRIVEHRRDNAAMRDYLLREVYRVGTFWLVLWLPTAWATLVMVSSLVLLQASERRRRQGTYVEGAERVSPALFNRRLGSDGIGISVWRGQLPWPRTRIRLPRIAEQMHILALGDSGRGKSTLLAQLLEQIDARGETAVVHDAALEYISEFYDEDRGDVILNPADERMPYWLAGEELTSSLAQESMAAALIQGSGKTSSENFFVDSARAILGLLLMYRPTVEQLVDWISRPEELDRRVAGTALAATIAPTAPSQRHGVLATLSRAARVLRYLPSRSESKRTWSVRQWAQQRRGWLFLGSQPETRAAVMPFFSLVVDMLVMRLMCAEGELPPPTWFILDELPVLGSLPQLPSGLAEGRKANCRFVLSLQAKSQLEARYGQEAEAMLSQPATYMVFHTREAEAAEWLSRTIGEMKVDLATESHTGGNWFGVGGTWTESHEYVKRRCVEPYEIQTLPRLHAIVVHDGVVSRIRLPRRPVRHGVPRFVGGPRWNEEHDRAGNPASESHRISERIEVPDVSSGVDDVPRASPTLPTPERSVSAAMRPQEERKQAEADARQAQGTQPASPPSHLLRKEEEDEEERKRIKAKAEEEKRNHEEPQGMAALAPKRGRDDDFGRFFQ